MQLKQRRIAILLPLGTLDTLSSVRDGIILFAQHGYLVDVYVLHNSKYPVPYFKNPAISVVINQPAVFSRGHLELPKWLLGRGTRLIRRLYRWFNFSFYGRLWRGLVFNRKLQRRHARIPYICIIGVEPEGLCDAARYASLLNVPLVYWSLELLFSDEIKNRYEWVLKQEEIIKSQQATFTIIQDVWRAQALINENNLDPARIIMVPNAPIGRARRNQSDFLRRKYKIDAERKIVLFAGSLKSWWAMSDEILEAASHWPDKYVLVMHSRQKYSSRYLNLLSRKTNSDRVIISHDPFTSTEFRSLIDSADVGIAFYRHLPPDKAVRNAGKNIKILGLSSGKVSDYLQSGLPVIVNECIGLSEVIELYNCGICVTDPHMIIEALSVIFSKYDYYVENACRCFNEKLEITRNFQPVLAQLEKCIL